MLSLPFCAQGLSTLRRRTSRQLSPTSTRPLRCVCTNTGCHSTCSDWSLRVVQGYDSVDHPRAIVALEYMLLSKIMLNRCSVFSVCVCVRVCVCLCVCVCVCVKYDIHSNDTSHPLANSAFLLTPPPSQLHPLPTCSLLPGGGCWYIPGAVGVVYHKQICRLCG